jgi:hypothetical protein
MVGKIYSDTAGQTAVSIAANSGRWDVGSISSRNPGTITAGGGKQGLFVSSGQGRVGAFEAYDDRGAGRKMTTALLASNLPAGSYLRIGNSWVDDAAGFPMDIRSSDVSIERPNFGSPSGTLSGEFTLTAGNHTTDVFNTNFKPNSFGDGTEQNVQVTLIPLNDAASAIAAAGIRWTIPGSGGMHVVTVNLPAGTERFRYQIIGYGFFPTTSPA